MVAGDCSVLVRTRSQLLLVLRCSVRSLQRGIRNEIPSPEKPGYPARLFAYLDMWKKMENKEKKVNNRYTGVLHI